MARVVMLSFTIKPMMLNVITMSIVIVVFMAFSFLFFMFMYY
jgi:hypothetical protein